VVLSHTYLPTHSHQANLMCCQVADIRNDPQTEAACAKDAPKLCPGVRPYRGLMHACLQRNMDKLRWVSASG
jgi:hypothetical protein